MESINLYIITSSEYIRRLIRYSVDDINVDIKIYDEISEIERFSNDFFIIIVENSLIDQKLKNFLLGLGHKFVIIIYDIAQVTKVKELFDENIGDFFVMEPVRSELLEIAIKIGVRYLEMEKEMELKNNQIEELKKQKEHLEKEIKKLIPSSDLKRNISGEIYKKVGTDRETLSKAYDIKDEDKS